jgi:hypothetical protein
VDRGDQLGEVAHSRHAAIRRIAGGVVVGVAGLRAMRALT